jgi:hypothetical protein
MKSAANKRQIGQRIDLAQHAHAIRKDHIGITYAVARFHARESNAALRRALCP